MGNRNEWRRDARGKRVRCDEKDDPEQWWTLRRETSLNQGTTGWRVFCLVCFSGSVGTFVSCRLKRCTCVLGILVVVIDEFFSRDIDLNHDRMKCEELDKVTYQSVCFVDNLRTPTTVVESKSRECTQAFLTSPSSSSSQSKKTPEIQERRTKKHHLETRVLFLRAHSRWKDFCVSWYSTQDQVATGGTKQKVSHRQLVTIFLPSTLFFCSTLTRPSERTTLRQTL